MLRNVLVVQGNGLVLFSKEFVNAIPQTRLIGGLLTAMLQFSAQNTGLPVSYIELRNVSVIIVTHDEPKVICAVFQDVEDGKKFGQLIAMETLQAFVKDYGSSLEGMGVNLKDFHGFTAKIPEVIKSTIRPILNELHGKRGVQGVTLVTEGGVVHTTANVDRLRVVAHLQPLLNLSTEIMAEKGDVPMSMTLEGGRTRTVVYRIAHATLIVVGRRTVEAHILHTEISETADLLRGVFVLQSSLSDSRYSRR